MRHLFIIRKEKLNSNLKEILKNEIETLINNKFNPEILSDFEFDLESNDFKIFETKEDILKESVESYSFKNYFQLTSKKEINYTNFIKNLMDDSVSYVIVNYELIS